MTVCVVTGTRILELVLVVLYAAVSQRTQVNALLAQERAEDKRTGQERDWERVTTHLERADALTALADDRAHFARRHRHLVHELVADRARAHWRVREHRALHLLRQDRASASATQHSTQRAFTLQTMRVREN